MSRTTKHNWQTPPRYLICAMLLLVSPYVAKAQSSDLSSPTPVFNGEISGRVTPLDVGDARLTRHFYTFNARPGDLEINIETNNLEGDIDLFTAVTMRPLAKVTLYAGLNSTVARTVFFRRDETLVLRVQARASNDTDGTYRIRLGGTFAASTQSASDESARNPESAANASREKPADRNVRRVNSVGARIEEPKPEVAAEPAAPSPVETARANEPAPPKATNAKTPVAKGRATRREPVRKGAAQRSTTETSASSGEGAKVEPGKTETAEPSTSNTETARSEPARPTTRTNRARPARSRATNRSTATNTQPSSEPSAPSATEPASPATTALGLEAPGSRLVLELRGGERVVREMSEVRRVAIEGRLIVIVLKNGRIERQPLANVARMTIEP